MTALPGHEVMPLLFVEVDNGTESPPIVADKIDRYRKFFARRVDLNGRPIPLWRIVWPASSTPTGTSPTARPAPPPPLRPAG